MIPVAILCGGKGTRLSPLTDHLPKSLVDVNGKPFLDWQLALLFRQGYRDVVLLTGHLGDQIRAYVHGRQKKGHCAMRIQFSDDGPIPLGGDAAIIKALPLLGPEFFVLYGDSYLDCDYAEIERTLRENPQLDAVITTWEGVDYGIRAFRRYPPDVARWRELAMPQRWEEIGSLEGLEHLRATLAR